MLLSARTLPVTQITNLDFGAYMAEMMTRGFGLGLDRADAATLYAIALQSDRAWMGNARGFA